MDEQAINAKIMFLSDPQSTVFGQMPMQHQGCSSIMNMLDKRRIPWGRAHNSGIN